MSAEELQSRMDALMRKMELDANTYLFVPVRCDLCGGYLTREQGGGTPCWNCLTPEQQAKRIQRNMQAYLE